MKKIFLMLFLIFALALPASAVDYTRYVDNSITDTNAASATPDCTNYNATTGACSGGSASAYKSLRDVVAFIDTLTNGTDTATIYFQRGGTWTFTSNADIVKINRSNVTIDAYGSGAKPILDGNNAYPTGVTGANIPYSYAIMIGDSGTVPVANVSIKNLKIQNMYPGGGIIFSGRDGGTAAGPGLVEYCDIENVGWAGIYDYGVHNVAGASYNIKFERNSVIQAGQYPKTGGWLLGWPTAIGAGYNTSGLEIRYNVTSNDYTEGIDVCNNSICEYNMVTDTHSGAIYYSAEDQDAGQVIIRYNLVWNDSDAGNTSAEIRVDDEVSSGDNSGSDIQIYGNVIIGGYAGIDIRNNPTYPTTTHSNWGSFKIYNNTLIDNLNNYIVSYPDRFTGPVVIKNNASIIHSDVAAICRHLDVWNATIGAAFTIGPNFFYGDATTSNSNLIAAFQHASNVFGTVAPLPKTSGWRSLTSLSSFSFLDLYPSATSQLVDRAETDQIAGFDQYLTANSDWETLPAYEDFVLADQGTDWDFGAIIRQQTATDPESIDAPTGLVIIKP